MCKIEQPFDNRAKILREDKYFIGLYKNLINLFLKLTMSILIIHRTTISIGEIQRCEIQPWG